MIKTKSDLHINFVNFNSGMIDIHELDAAFQSAGLHFPRRVMKKLIAQVRLLLHGIINYIRVRLTTAKLKGLISKNFVSCQPS